VRRELSWWERYGVSVVLILLAFALGWSIAHASLSVPEIIRIAALEVHPPLFYLILKPWLVLGRNVFVIRFFPVFISMIAVPVMFRLALRWGKRPPLAFWAEGLLAVAPAVVYYAQVVRMYPLVLLWLLCDAWAILSVIDGAGRRATLSLILAGVLSLYTFYYSAFALLGLYLYGLAVTRLRRRAVWRAGLVTGGLYVPWLAYAGPQMLQHIADASPPEAVMPVTFPALARSIWTALTFDLETHGLASWLVLVLLVVGVFSAWHAREKLSQLVMPGLVLATSVTGIVWASGTYFFAARLFTPAVPFLLLVTAWALDRLGAAWWGLPYVAMTGLLVAFWPTSSGFVYEKGLEVSGDFDPHEYHRMLAERAGPDDVVFFDELALAGWYDVDRTAKDPDWSYALRWTPTIEPLDVIVPRVEQASDHHRRMWFVLYRGTVGPGRELKDWLDRSLYPTSVDWGTDSLFLSYVDSVGPWRELTPTADFGDIARLELARFTTQIGPQGQVGVQLYWRALHTEPPDCRVVVQVWDERGVVLAQRDAAPHNWERPVRSWKAGEMIKDHHGLLLSGDSDTVLHVAVSMYEVESGLPLAVNGRPFLELGTLVQNR